MDPKILKLLNTQEQTTELKDIATKCIDLLRLSRNEMKKYYDDWDRHDRVYRGEVKPDDQDKKSAARGEPIKMIVPLTFQQVQTYAAFAYQTLTQRPYFYELTGVGQEDMKPAGVAQAVLAQNLDYNRYTSDKLIQLLTDYAKYGICVQKHSWEHKTNPILETVPDPAYQQTPPQPGQPQVAPPMIEQVRDVTKFLGNKIVVVSPYRFFPDPRLPLTRCQEGEFVATEEEYSWDELNYMESQGLIAGSQFANKTFDPSDQEGRRLQFVLNDRAGAGAVPVHYGLVSEIQIMLNPAKTFYDSGKALDERIDRTVPYVVWLINGKRMVRIEPMGYDHQEFTVDCAQFYPDQTHFINGGISDTIESLQDTITWFINARITNVRRVISNMLVVDPTAVEFQDLKDRSPVIRLKKTYSGSGIDQYIKQLQIQDVTSGHLNDVQFLTGIAREVTGINDNIMGSYSPGRRSAQESRNVNSNAAGRLLVTIANFWDSLALPQGKKMISNLRQGLDEQTLVRVIGISQLQNNPDGVNNFLYVSKDDLVGNYDFIIFDGMLASQRGYTAQTISEVLGMLAKDPRLVFALGLDPKLLLFETLELRDVRNPERFGLTPQRFQQLAVLAGVAANPGAVANAVVNRVNNTGQGTPAPQTGVTQPGSP